jgi:hypothetical protein
LVWVSRVRRRISIALAVVLAVVAGIASASLVSPGTAAEPLLVRDELPAGSVETGSPLADPRGGPSWAVRVLDGETSMRCIVAGRVQGSAFGPVDAKGRVQDSGTVTRGSCADPQAEPLQIALARYPQTAGTGARSVLFGVASAEVKSVEVVTPGVQGPVTLDAARTFLVVSEGLTSPGESTVEVTLTDGTTRSYRL